MVRSIYSVRFITESFFLQRGERREREREREKRWVAHQLGHTLKRIFEFRHNLASAPDF
jgi:hypothetical protein